MKLAKQTLIIFCVLSCCITLHAGNLSDSLPLGKNGWFTYAPYGKSLLSDTHPNFVRFEVVENTNHPTFDFTHSGKKFRPSTEGNDNRKSKVLIRSTPNRSALSIQDAKVSIFLTP